MKRILLIAMAVLLPVLLTAQSAVTSGRDALKKISELTKGEAVLANMSAAKWSQVKNYVDKAASDPATANQLETWKWKLKVLEYDRTQALQEYQAKGEFKDKKAFFENEHTMVYTASKYCLLLQKSSTSLKRDDHVDLEWAGLLAQTSWPNLLAGASLYFETQPALAVKWMKTYFNYYDTHSDNPFFGPQKELISDAAYVYATALKNAGASDKEVIEWLVKALNSSYGVNACLELYQMYWVKGDKVNEQKYLQYGYEHFPSLPNFGLNIMENYLKDKNYAEVVKIADQMILRDKNGMYVDEEGKKYESASSIYYIKATSLYNSGKVKEAYDAFVDGDTQHPGNIDLVIGAGASAWTYARDHISDQAVFKSWMEKAIHYYSKAERQWPDESNQWAYPLFGCYHYLGNKEMEEKYKKYLDN